MRSVCVFCGSSPGVRPQYSEAADRLGALLASRGIQLVYGGSNVGLMDRIASSTMRCGGRVLGVLPTTLEERERAHQGLTELVVVGTMHERKSTMYARSDGFIAMPGGFGTLEEIFEIVTWAQIGLHTKPCGLLDVQGFYAPLVAFLEHAVREGLLRQEYRDMLLVDSDPERLIEKMTHYRAATLPAAPAGALA